MSTPQGPDRYGADPDHSGPPTWGTPPPGGWGAPDAGPPTGAWDPAADGFDDRGAHDDPRGGYDDARGGHDEPTAYVGRRRAEDRDADATTAVPWGDGYEQARDGYGQPRDGYGQQPDDPWSDGGATQAWDPDRDSGDRFAPGDEPWAPREEVRRPRRGPGGLGRGALVGIGVGVVLVAALLVGLFVTPGWALSRTLDKTALQNGVTQVLTQSYGLQVGAVECPDDVAVEAGTAFSCQALVDGEPVTVPGTVTSDEGDYQVKRV